MLSRLGMIHRPEIGPFSGALLLGLLCAPPVLADGSSSASYAIPTDVINAGGGNSAAASSLLFSSIASGKSLLLLFESTFVISVLGTVPLHTVP